MFRGSSCAPSSGIFHCTFGTGICHTGLMTAFKHDQDGRTLKLSSNLYDIYQWRMYSGKLLMMGRGTAPKHVESLDKNKFGKLVRPVGFIKKKFVTMHGHMSRCKVTCHDARSHVTMHGHMSRCTITCYDARSHVTMQGHMLRCKVTCHDARSHVTMHGHTLRCTVTRTYNSLLNRSLYFSYGDTTRHLLSVVRRTRR